MFSSKLRYLPSSDERVQCRDESSSAYPCGPTHATATFQGQTKWILADEESPSPVPASH